MNDLRGAFRVLQVVSGATTTIVTTTSATYVDTTLTATITPQSSSSKILAMVSQTLYIDTASTDVGLTLLRGASVIVDTKGIGFSGGGLSLSQWATNLLDSPATTSATTYKTQVKRNSGAGTLVVNVNSNIATLILMEISA